MKYKVTIQMYYSRFFEIYFESLDEVNDFKEYHHSMLVNGDQVDLAPFTKGEMLDVYNPEYVAYLEVVQVNQRGGAIWKLLLN